MTEREGQSQQQKERETVRRGGENNAEARSLPRANQVPFVRLAAKAEEEEEDEEAREEVREKRRAACVSLGAGSRAGEGSGREKRHGEEQRKQRHDKRDGVNGDAEEEEGGAQTDEALHRMETKQGRRRGNTD